MAFFRVLRQAELAPGTVWCRSLTSRRPGDQLRL